VKQLNLATTLPLFETAIKNGMASGASTCFSTRIEAPISVSEERISMESTNRSLMWYGMCLFLIGLLTGFAEQHFANMRMGLAAHLEGVMNGTFLLALGAVWNEVRLTRPYTAIAYWAALYGTYGNWLVTTLAAVFGTAALSPITGAGQQGLFWQEKLVTVGFQTVGVAIVASSVLVLWGLRARAFAVTSAGKL
jgi:(hydroxyamino)benzene mutase